jgi:hypothetical protein
MSLPGTGSQISMGEVRAEFAASTTSPITLSTAPVTLYQFGNTDPFSPTTTENIGLSATFGGWTNPDK